MDSNSNATVLIDGISSVSSHNGVHRLVFFKLAADGKPTPAVELAIPPGAMRSVAEAIGRLK